MRPAAAAEHLTLRVQVLIGELPPTHNPLGTDFFCLLFDMLHGPWLKGANSNVCQWFDSQQHAAGGLGCWLRAACCALANANAACIQAS